MQNFKSKYSDFNKWLLLPDKEKIRIIQSLDAYSKEGNNLLRKIYKKFRTEYSKLPDVIDISWGVYHGGHNIIGVTLYAKSKLKLPSYYEGVIVQEGYTYITKSLRKKIGKICNEIGEYIDLHYKSLLKELRKRNLTLESASRDEIISIVDKLK